MRRIFIPAGLLAVSFLTSYALTTRARRPEPLAPETGARASGASAADGPRQPLPRAWPGSPAASS